MITLHHCHQTRSMRILWLLEELGVDYEVKVHPFDKSLRGAEFLSRSPAGRVPAIELLDQTLFESGAIIQVLCQRYPERGLGRTPDDLDWPDWLAWLHFAETLTQSTAALTIQHVTLRDDTMRSPVLMRLEAARVGKCFDAVEARLSTPVENRDHLLTSGFSAADIAVGQAVWFGMHFHRLDTHPETAAWMGRLMERPAFVKSLPPDGAELLYKQDYYEAPRA